MIDRPASGTGNGTGNGTGILRYYTSLQFSLVGIMCGQLSIGECKSRLCVCMCVCVIRKGGKSTARKLRKTPKNATPTTKRPPQTDEWKESSNSRCRSSSCSCRKERKQKQHKRTNKWTNLALLIGICITIFHLQFDRLSADRVWQCTPALIVCVCASFIGL